jgi:hypothetical protein
MMKSKGGAQCHPRPDEDFGAFHFSFGFAF